MSNILVLPLNSNEVPPGYEFVRETRQNRYYKRIGANPNAMDIQQVMNASDDVLDGLLKGMNNMGINGGKRKSRMVKRRKTRKSRKVRKSRKSRKH
jgi:hypothetical protein